MIDQSVSTPIPDEESVMIELGRTAIEAMEESEQKELLTAYGIEEFTNEQYLMTGALLHATSQIENDPELTDEQKEEKIIALVNDITSPEGSHDSEEDHL